MKQYRMSYDKNGNQLLQVKVDVGDTGKRPRSFSLQSNGNLPGIHSDHGRTKGNVILTNDQERELNAYVTQYGTQRQRAIVSAAILTNTNAARR